MLTRRALGFGAASLATPAIAQSTSTLRFVPQANFASLDPISAATYVVRNAALLVWDTLFGVDAGLQPQPQMVEAWETAPDGRLWRFRLRPNLVFHDNTPVLARDAVASLERWMARDTMGLLLRARLDAMVAEDDRTFVMRLRQPFPKMLTALAKGNGRVAFIMPERVARTDPFKPIAELVGSGPMRFRRTEWVPGALAVFERFTRYQPRPEPSSWMAGGKRMLLDRIEWRILPDPSTAAAALQQGEVDWLETPLQDLLPRLRNSRQIVVEVADPLGNIGALRMNHLQPPFDDIRARRAVQMALSQADTMLAITGDDEAARKPCPSFFTPGTPAYTEAGGEPLKGVRRVDEARRLLAEAGYAGAPVVVLAATDVALTKVQADITGDLLGRLGFAADVVATDWGTLAARRTNKGPPAQGGWNIFHTWHAGADCITPAAYPALAATGGDAWFGWPKSDEVTRAIDGWYAATPEAEKTAIEAINRTSMEFVTYVPTGFFLTYQAYRRTLSGVKQAPFPVFWGVSKT